MSQKSARQDSPDSIEDMPGDQEPDLQPHIWGLHRALAVILALRVKRVGLIKA